jgi:hypothetical protein
MRHGHGSQPASEAYTQRQLDDHHTEGHDDEDSCVFFVFCFVFCVCV